MISWSPAMAGCGIRLRRDGACRRRVHGDLGERRSRRRHRRFRFPHPRAIFNAGGAATTEAFVVNTTTDGDQGEVSLTTLADGRVVATWRDESGTPAGDFGHIRAQIVDPRTHAVNLIGTGLDDDWVGTGFIDSLSGSGGDDRMDGAGGNDHLFGGAGIDRLTGSPGDDVLDGGAGADTMTGGAGDDTYVVDNAGDEVIEKAGEGIDTVVSSIAFVLGAKSRTSRSPEPADRSPRPRRAASTAPATRLPTRSPAATRPTGSTAVTATTSSGRGGRDKLIGGSAMTLSPAASARTSSSAARAATASCSTPPSARPMPTRSPTSR